MIVASFVVSALALAAAGASPDWNVLGYLLAGQRAELNVTVNASPYDGGNREEPVVLTGCTRPRVVR